MLDAKRAARREAAVPSVQCALCSASVDGGRWTLINDGSYLGQRDIRPHLLQPPRYSSSGIVCYMLATFFHWDFMGASLKDHIKRCGRRSVIVDIGPHLPNIVWARRAVPDRKSTRLNSSHGYI